MKLITILFIILVAWIITPEAIANETYKNSYCSGYANKMAKVYRLKYYRDMQFYFDSKIQETSIDIITHDYYKSGSNSVRDEVSIQTNLITKCEEAYKRRIS